MCEEFEFYQDRSWQPDVLMGQSIVLSEIKAELPLQHDISSHQNILFRMFGNCKGRLYLCEEVWYRTMVIYWSRFRKGMVLIKEDSPQGIWDHIEEKMLVEFAECGCPISF